MEQGVEIVPVDRPGDDVGMLIGLLNDELGSLYGPEQRHGLDLAALFQPYIRFFLAYWRGQPAGCGGVALLNGFAEVKRMFVRPAWRGEGLADAVMDRLIANNSDGTNPHAPWKRASIPERRSAFTGGGASLSAPLSNPMPPCRRSPS